MERGEGDKLFDLAVEHRLDRADRDEDPGSSAVFPGSGGCTGSAYRHLCREWDAAGAQHTSLMVNRGRFHGLVAAYHLAAW